MILSIDQLPESLETFTDDGQILHQINILHGDGDGPGLQGDGVVIGVGEIGNVSDHIDLEGKIIRFGNGSVSYNEHTDHVVGILAGQATLDDNNGGVAPEGQIILAQNFDIIANAGLLQSQYGMVVTNNSYGPFLKCEREDNVNVFTEIIDKSLRELPEMLHVFAAGNFGNLSCEGRTEGFFNLSPSYAVAKNILTVGSVDINGEIAFNSSRGPTLDGRLKPEICAKGVQTISLSSGGGYTTKSGTSIAAPLVTGTSALLTEAYRLQHQGANPDGGLIKAILCNTANDLGLPGPDFTHGFGLMNARRALLSLKQNHFEKGTLSHAQEFEMPLQVEANANQLKVLLYWPDWENVENVIYDPALINDLDLEVIAPDGTLVLPTVADASRADQAAKPQVDRLNNIEQVIIDRPQAGTYTLRIKGHHIPFGPQPFYVSYEAIQPEVVLTYPNGGEQFAPEDEVLIVWDADALNDKSFRLEYSLDGGASWNGIASQIPAQERTYQWTLPAQYSETAMVRIRKNGTSLEDSNELPFYILDQLERPEVSYDCDGVLQLAWTASQTASRYEVLLYKDGALEVLATVDEPKASIPNLDYDQIQWVSVRGLTGSGLQTARTETIRVPVGLPDGPAFELELGMGVSCAGEMDGEATVLPSTSSDNYTYQWDNGENGPTAFSLSAGVHRVTVTDALGCQQSASIEVPSPAPLSVTIRTQPAHAGETDGEATAEVQGGTAPYTYRWSMAVSHTSSQVDQLAAGNYQLTITDDNACKTVQEFT
ncbi:MAG: S8 family serine peptidase, partial [Bacteroidota bacterium]